MTATEPVTIEKWRNVFRNGFAPILPLEALEAFRDALRNDDPRWVQGSTTVPPPLMCVQDWPCEAGCMLGYMAASINGGFNKNLDGTINPGATTIGAVEEQFARWCFDADQRLGEPAACRYQLDWHDDVSREEVRRELLPEVERAIALRQQDQSRA